MQSAAVAERERLERELQRIEVRKEKLLREIAALEASSAELRERILMLNHLTHEATDNGVVESAGPRHGSRELNKEDQAPHRELTGARIREAAVRVLVSSPSADGPVHYRVWFELLTKRGLLPAGKNPVATFLTQIGRSPVVARTTTPGMYVLDRQFPDRARRQLEDLRGALHHAHDVPSDADLGAIVAARSRRAELTREIEATERALEEALRSLGAPDDGLMSANGA